MDTSAPLDAPTTPDDAHPDPVRIGVLLGSTRPTRRAPAIADWVLDERGLEGATLDRIDVADLGLPLLQEPVAAAFGRYEAPATRAWSARAAALDAFVLVTPEYNASTSAALKNALDHLYLEWRDKPVAYVGYGMAGGIRAVEHLRTITAELGMAGVPQALHLSATQVEDGGFAASAPERVARQEMLTVLVRWARAFRRLRGEEAA